MATIRVVDRIPFVVEYLADDVFSVPGDSISQSPAEGFRGLILECV
jgi:hypothetical protein